MRVALLAWALVSGCAPAYGGCESNEDCVVVVDFGADELSRDVFSAIRADGYEAYCADHGDCVCGSTIPCFCPAVFQGGALVATCHRRRCAVVDLHVVGMTECTSDADCMVAHQACCAEPPAHARCTNAAYPTAVSRAHEATLRALVCDEEPSCEPPVAPGIARCVEGSCRWMVSSE